MRSQIFVHNGEEIKEMPAKKSLTAGSIWNTLVKMNVNEHTEDKGGYTYLSWSHAYRIMMENYPELEIAWDAVTYYEGGTAMVACTVTIGDVSREMWLPVMDYKMKSIAHPSSRDISDTKMRCLVKCFSMYGLFNYGYSGDGLPMEESNGVTKAPVKKPIKAKAQSNGVVQDEAEETVQALKDLCNEVFQAGWVPDDTLKAGIKSAIAGRDIKTIAKLMIQIHKISEVALQINDEREQGELIDA